MYIQKKKRMVEKNLKSLILKQYQSADLKSFWNWFEISDFCKDFSKFYFLCGHRYKAGINGLDIAIEQKTFFWNVF